MAKQNTIQENKELKNKNQEIKIEKMVLNCGAIGDKLEKSVKLLEVITGKKVCKSKSTKRIPDFGISPGKESGCRVTLRDEEQIIALLKRFFAARDNTISRKMIVENQMSFGIEEYIEIPGLEYNRDIGILGFELSLVFTRNGKRVKYRKIKQGKYPKRQIVTRDEILNFMNKHFKLEVTK